MFWMSGSVILIALDGTVCGWVGAGAGLTLQQLNLNALFRNPQSPKLLAN